MVDATKNNREDAIRFIKSEIARGGTKHLKPILAAIEQAPDAIFFLTDGDDNDAMSPMQLNEIKRKNKKNIQINVIQFGNGKYQTPSDFLQQIAKDNNGKYTYINIQEL
jgi:secreted protein with Ig-like and vWFA domain